MVPGPPLALLALAHAQALTFKHISRGGNILNEIKTYSSACFLGGLLRVISCFVNNETATQSIEVLYIGTDLCLILGLIGFYSVYRAQLFWLGHIGFIIAICGLGFIAWPETELFGVFVYQIGSLIIGIGVLLLSLNLIRANLCGFVAPVALVASVAAGLMSMLVGGSLLVFASGALFGLGVMALGIQIWKVSKQPTLSIMSKLILQPIR
tara:strand:+ start:853 stop:1482 length:630 start_codon:yes stop_codon:yes gene_type:complete